MISNQTNQIEALSNAELDNVAGGFRFDIFKMQLGGLMSALHHPIHERATILQDAKAMAFNFGGGYDNFGK